MTSTQAEAAHDILKQDPDWEHLSDGVDVWIFRFDPSISSEKITEVWAMARAAMDGLRGVAVRAMGTPYWFEDDSRVVCVEVGTEAGREQARIFFGLIEEALGHESLDVRRARRKVRRVTAYEP